MTESKGLLPSRVIVAPKPKCVQNMQNQIILDGYNLGI